MAEMSEKVIFHEVYFSREWSFTINFGAINFGDKIFGGINFGEI